MICLKKWFFCLVILIFTTSLFAEESSLEKESGKTFLIGYSGNYPVAHSSLTYEHSQYHPLIGMRHISENWVLGIATQYKFLKNKIDGSKLVLWALQEEINYKFRIYDPLYFLFGAKFLYLFPIQKGMFPFHKNEQFRSEVGVGTTASLTYFFMKKTGVGVFVDLWRGTATQKFQSLEFGIQMSIPLFFGGLKRTTS